MNHGGHLPSEVHVLDKECELRVEVGFGQSATIKLLSGTAEVFGTELGDQPYTISGRNFAVFTWFGAKIEVSGQLAATSYVSSETPMVSYLNVHQVIESRRDAAKQAGKAGPRVCIVGPTDSGKSTLCRLLLSYAARKGNKPLFVDCDVGQGQVTIPCCLAATVVAQPVDIEDGIPLEAPLAYFYGHTSPSENPPYYKKIVDEMKTVLDTRKLTSESLSSGMIVNTCGWVDGLGLELLMHTIRVLECDIVLVVGQERLLNELRRKFPPPIDIVNIAKSAGVVTRCGRFRHQTRNNTVREYFYGPAKDLCPHQTTLHLGDVKIYRIGSGPAAPSSALPIGAKSSQDPCRAVEVVPNGDLVHSVLAVTHATNPEDLSRSNVAGFVHVTDVDVANKRLVVLSPCPGPLPSNILLLGSLKWMES